MSGLARNPVCVLQVGPARDAIGGMASVVNQIGGLVMAPRFEMAQFYCTSAAHKRESLISRLIRHVGALVRLGRTIRHRRCAIVHIHTCSGFSFHRSILDLLVARAMGCRIVLHVHGASFDEFFERASFVGKFLIRQGLRCAQSVIALSESWRRKIESMSPHARITVIENAVAIPERENDDSKPFASSPDGRACRFLLLARMDRWKGIDDLLEAFEYLKQDNVLVELTLAGPAGSAGNAQSLPERIGRLGLSEHVRYVGEVRGAAKDDLLRNCDVYIQPSHNEGMPISVLEALAFGLPVVATDVGALREVITEGREGYIVPPHAPPDLARAMARMAMDSNERHRMARAAESLARQRFSEARLRDDLKGLYDSVIARSAPESAVIERAVTASRDTSPNVSTRQTASRPHPSNIPA